MSKRATSPVSTNEKRTTGSFEEFAYHLFLQEIGSNRELKLLLEESAIPHWFTLVLLAWLHEGRTEASGEISGLFAKISQSLASFLEEQEDRFSWQDGFRRMLLSKIPEERQRDLHRRAARYHAIQLSRPLEEKTTWQQEDWLLDHMRELIYHLLPTEPDRGLSLLEKIFTSLEREFAFGTLSRLLEAAEEQSHFLSPDQQLEINYLQARWARLAGRLWEVQEILERMRSGNMPLPPHLDGRILQDLARVYEERGEDWHRVAEMYRDSIRRYEQSGDYEAAIDTYVSLAQLYRTRGRREEALAIFQEVLGRFGQQISEPVHLGRVYEEIGTIYLESENWTAALEAYRQSKEQFERAQYPTGMVRVLLGLGRCYQAIGNEMEAQDQFRQALELVDRERGILINLTGSLKEHPHREEILKILGKEIINLQKRVEATAGEIYLEPLCKMHIYAAEIEQELGNVEMALEHYAQALQIFEGAGAGMRVAEILLARAALYEREGRYAEARADLERAMPVLEESENEALLDRAREILARMPQ